MREPLGLKGYSTCIVNGIDWAFFFFFGLFRAAPAAYGGSQARG